MREKSKVDVMLDEYYERFGRSFPIVFGEHYTEKELLKELNDCLKSNTPKKPKGLDNKKIY